MSNEASNSRPASASQPTESDVLLSGRVQAMCEAVDAYFGAETLQEACDARARLTELARLLRKPVLY